MLCGRRLCCILVSPDQSPITDIVVYELRLGLGQRVIRRTNFVSGALVP